MKNTPLIKEMSPGFHSLFKWLPITLLVGVVLGLVGTAFHHAIEIVTEFREHNPWILLLLPLIGALVALIYKSLRLEKDPGTNIVLRSIYSKDTVPFRLAPAIFLAATLTHLGGASSGREGAALQLGGSIAGWLGRLIKLSEADMSIITMCGMSATFSALFGTPLTAAIFSVEVVSVGLLHPSALLPCLIASLCGFGVASLLGVHATSFVVAEIPKLTLLSIGQTLALGILCAAVAIVFCGLMHKVGDLFKTYIPHLVLRGILGGTIVLLLTILFGSQDYNGAGMHIVEAAIAGSAFEGAFLLKMLITAISLGAGFKGGEIVPVMFVGSTFGCVVAPFLGLPAAFGAAAGLVAVFCGVVNCPIASFILAIELFGGQGLVLFAVAVMCSHLMSGYVGLYHDQQMPYSKYIPEFVDHSAE